MTLASFARLCETIEHMTPTNKVRYISGGLQNFNSKTTVMKILSMDYPVNNIGGKRAITWVANALGVFEDEIDDGLYTWGDLGETLFEIDDGNETDSEITMSEFSMLLHLDCSRIESDSYIMFSESLNQMSAREKKWFIRYWLRKPRNGVNNKIPLKVIANYFGLKQSVVDNYANYNSAGDIFTSLFGGNTPECILTHGQFINPMLAKARKGKERPSNYIVDIKYDGNRYQIHKEGESVIIFNRKGKVVTDQYPDIVEIVSKFEVSNVILDTEIYPVNPDGSPAPHKLLGKRVHKKDKAEAVRECPVKMVAFDCLSSYGIARIEDPLVERIMCLSCIPSEYRAETFDDHTIQAAYNIAIDRGFEGIMIKDANMTYQPGKRSKGWLKYKPPRISLDVVITTAEYGEGKRANVFGTYGISVKDGSDFSPIGKVGTGFSDDDLQHLTTTLKKNIDYLSDGVFFLLPRVVLEVTSDLVTKDANGNIGLRFPRCVRIREDKYAADIDTLEGVKELL